MDMVTTGTDMDITDLMPPSTTIQTMVTVIPATEVITMDIEEPEEVTRVTMVLEPITIGNRIPTHSQEKQV